MNKEIFDSKFLNFSDALVSLKEAYSESIIHKNDDFKYFSIFRDSVIQRFEYTFELSWKFMKFLAINIENDLEARTSYQSIKSSFKSGYISNIEIWFDMIDYRNKTSHEYEENIANDLYYNIGDYIDEIQKFYELIKYRYENGYFTFDN